MQINSQDKVVVFSQNNCQGCDSAKALLKSKGIEYHERNLTTDPDAKQAMLKSIPGARSVPQIMIGAKVIGGLDMLRKYLDRG